ncbi:unnamed protein product [Symbiodinium sp. CCMP2456]|nr:unnamed protein product [Symbiodinium sp. CCMP2456]
MQGCVDSVRAPAGENEAECLSTPTSLRRRSRFFPIAAYSEILLADPASIERSSESQVDLCGVAWRLFLDLLVYRLVNCRVYAVSLCKALAKELQALTRDRFLCYYVALAVCSLFLGYYVALALCYLCCLLMFVGASNNSGNQG